MTDPSNSSIEALNRLGEQFFVLERAEHSGRSGRWVRRGAGAAFVLGVLALTPAGSAAIDGFESLVGIGDKPSEGSIAPTGVVIGGGTTPSGTAYEVVADARGFAAPDTCVGIEFPQSPERSAPFSHAFSCLTDTSLNKVEQDGIHPYIYPPLRPIRDEVGAVATAFTDPAVADVEVTYTTTDGETLNLPTSVSKLDEALSSQIGSADEVGFVLAFLPTDSFQEARDGPMTVEQAQENLDRVSIRARDQDGDVLYESSFGEFQSPQQAVWTFGTAHAQESSSRDEGVGN